MRGPFFMSIGLHIIICLVMVWATQPAKGSKKQLPAATVVKLLRPAAPQGKPSPKPPAAENGQRPSSTLEIPKPKKDKKATESKPVEKQPSAPKPKAKSEQKIGVPGIGKEVVSEAGILGVAGEGFEYDFYLAVVQSKIEQNFRPPPGVRSRNLATVSFTIEKTGAISELKLYQSSGNLLIDQAAERAIRAAGRFPPLPPQYDKGALNIYFEFVVNPTRGG